MKTPLCLPVLGLIAFTNTSFKISPFTYLRTVTSNTYYVLVEKLKYELNIFDSSGERMVTYPVVFGNKDMGDKMMQGDRKTPEGTFHIISKRKHEKWNSFISLDYPNAESYQKFNDRKARGLLPANAQIGGGIGIHGTWPHEDFAIDRYDNWTEGCISTKNMYIQEIFSMLPLGTRVEIRK
jgi:murein L,D-transpeptidase YafK